jgi:hypothetical protein
MPVWQSVKAFYSSFGVKSGFMQDFLLRFAKIH